MKHNKFTTRTELKSLGMSIECAKMECGSLRMFRVCLVCSSMRLGDPFIAPRQLGAVESNPGRQFLPSVGWRSRPLNIWSRWRTGQFGAPIRPLARPRVTRGLRGRPLARPTVGSPDSPVNFSRTPLTNSRERPVDQTPIWRIGNCPVHTGQSGAPRPRRVLAAPAKSFSFCVFSDSST
jgi:hypothetical protein